MIWDPSGFPAYHPLVYAGTATASILALAVIVFLPLLSRKTRPGVIDLGVAAICIATSRAKVTKSSFLATKSVLQSTSISTPTFEPACT